MVLTGILAISDWVDLQDRLSPTMSGSLLAKYPVAEKKPCTGHASPRLPMLAFDHQRVQIPSGTLTTSPATVEGLQQSRLSTTIIRSTNAVSDRLRLNV
jgi:hypothetical protein